MNTLYYGDNLNILREHIADKSVDLIYLDPPFNSNRNYNVLFKNESGTESESQITAFEDTWHWNQQAEQTYHELINEPDQVGRMIEAFRSFIGQNQMMAYLTMMAVRLKELHRVLKPTGSLYLHCDPTASHYLKILLDTIFGAENYRNEITWLRTNAHNYKTKGWVRANDIIFYFTKSNIFTFNQIYTEYSEAQLKRYKPDETGRLFTGQDLTYTGRNPDRQFEWRGVRPAANRVWGSSIEQLEKLWNEGRILKQRDGRPRLDGYKMYLDEAKGRPATTNWTDIERVANTAGERMDYPTQKPVALLERIISASSNEGDVVLDPFCGCGTTIAAAQKLNRQWIGIDITHLSVGLQKYRLRHQFGILPFTGKLPFMPSGVSGEISTGKKGESGLIEKQAYRVIGQPEDLEGARELADKDKYGFQWWILPLIGAKAFGSEAGKKEGKKGADGGIDGMIVFTDDTSGKAKRVIVSVKGGGVNVSQIRDLGHVVEREKAAIGIFLTLEKPTKPMIEEAVGKGFYHSEGWGKDYPRIQILTVEDVLAGKQPELPPNIDTFKKAGKVMPEKSSQASLFKRGAGE